MAGVSLSFTSLLVPDPDTAVVFYREVFGLEEVISLASPHFRGLWVGATVLGLSGPHAHDLLGLPPVAAGERGVTAFLTFEAEDRPAVDRLTARAAALGGEVVRAPAETYYGAWQSVLRDPDGHAFRINHLAIAG